MLFEMLSSEKSWGVRTRSFELRMLYSGINMF